MLGYLVVLVVLVYVRIPSLINTRWRIIKHNININCITMQYITKLFKQSSFLKHSYKIRRAPKRK